jgi:hypothetical protein
MMVWRIRVCELLIIYLSSFPWNGNGDLHAEHTQKQEAHVVITFFVLVGLIRAAHSV